MGTGRHPRRDGGPHDKDGTGSVRDMALDEVRRLDAGKGECIPTLEEAIQAVRGRAVLQIELKGEGTVGRPARPSWKRRA